MVSFDFYLKCCFCLAGFRSVLSTLEASDAARIHRLVGGFRPSGAGDDVAQKLIGILIKCE